jgi:Ricin-type beta-trefoil lectin domain-like
MKVRRILASLGASVLMAAALVTFSQQAADAIGTVQFRPLLNVGSGKCLTVQPNENGYVDNALRIVIQTCNGSTLQSWQFIQAGRICDGNCSFAVPIFWIQNQATGKCIDLNDGSSANTTRVQQWDCVDTNNMKWVSSPYPYGLPADAHFQLSNARAGTCMDVQWGGTDDFTPLQGYHCFDYPNNGAQMYQQG